MRGYSLVSQNLRRLISEGRLLTEGVNPGVDVEEIRVREHTERRIQPSSFEPILEGEGFVLDTETEGLFRSTEGDSVYRALMHLPRRQRRAIDINSGYPLVAGHSYLLKLRERVALKGGERMKSSPKSTSGREFLNCRLLVDYHTGFDEAKYKGEKHLDLWLLVQPQAFNVIVRPGLTLNQLRFFDGLDALLTENEVIEEHRRNPLLLETRDGELVPADLESGELLVTLNLDGRDSSGIIALQARNNPEPIDLSKVSGAVAEDYFEPVVAENGSFTPVPGKYYLLSSRQVLRMPAHLNTQLRATHHTGLQGLLHFAGFVDNGFEGDLVFELRSDERTPVVIRKGTPISILDAYRCREPSDKVYGPDTRANYQGQKGPRVSKHFTLFDFGRAGKEHKKLDRLVMVEERERLLALRREREGFEPVYGEEQTRRVVEISQGGFFLSRYDCEDDPRVLQIIPYVIVFGPDGTVFSYKRAKDMRDYGDRRLFDKHSIGLGGHVIKTDGPGYVRRCLEREVFEEEVKFKGSRTEPVLVGTLYKPEKEVDTVHFGLVYAVYTDGAVEVNEASIAEGRMVQIDELLSNPQLTANSETWTRVLLPHLGNIRRQIGY